MFTGMQLNCSADGSSFLMLLQISGQVFCILYELADNLYCWPRHKFEVVLCCTCANPVILFSELSCKDNSLLVCVQA